MADILLDLPIRAARERVFAAVSTPAGLDSWWTKRSSGDPARPGTEYQLWFGPEYDWRGTIIRSASPTEFALRLVEADPDWMGTVVQFDLEARDSGTWLRFGHLGWPSVNEHYRISANCWAAYLRILRRSLEHGESVPYEQRLEA